MSLFPEPVAPRAAPAAVPGACRAARRVPTPGLSPVAPMARGPPPPAPALCTRVSGREKRGWPASGPGTAARAESEPTERSAAPWPTTTSGRGLQPPPRTPAGRPFSGGPHTVIFRLPMLRPPANSFVIGPAVINTHTPNTLFRPRITPLCQDVRDTLMSRFSALALGPKYERP